MTVLIVDDDRVLLDAMERGLSRLGYKIARAERASEAINHMESMDHIDCIVTDLQLPGTGEQVIRSAKKLKVGHPVLVVTGCEDFSKRQRAANAGATVVLMKPQTIGNLHRQIQRVTSGSPFVRNSQGEMIPRPSSH